MSAVVIGIGQSLAGDDGVGLVVAREVAARGIPVREATDASALLPLLEEGRQVVLVDAVAGGGPPGTVLRLDPAALATGPSPISSHGLGVAEAIALARMLYGDEVVRTLAIVGVAIDPATRGTTLSAEVALAVPRAADLVASLARPSVGAAFWPVRPRV